MPLHSGSGHPPPIPRHKEDRKSNKQQPKRNRRIHTKGMAQRKFDSGSPPLAKLPGHMFHHVAEVLSWNDLESPAPSYPEAYPDWKDDTEAAISEMLVPTGVAQDDEESFEIGKQIGFRALEKFVAKATAVGWSSQPAETRREAADAILTRPQVPQRTQEWYAQGKAVLTASEFAKLLGTPRAVSQLVMSKVPTDVVHQTNRLACRSCDMGPFDWGIRFEPVVKQILTEKWGVIVADTGRILHPTDPNIAASPDGIFLTADDPTRVGRLVEIKCPVTRVIGEGVPFDYWCQMQVQMEVTGIDECDYVEVKLDSIQGAVTDLSGAVHGHVWLLQHPMTCDMRYAYTEAEMTEIEAGGYELTEKVPWRLNSMYAVTVTRDRAWFQGTAELRRQFWENVEKARQGTFQIVEGRPKVKTVIVTKEPACMITD